MNLRFALLVFTLGLILGSSNAENLLEIKDKVESNPNLSCLLFGQEGCHMECSITGELFNFTSRGICDLNQVCNCHNHKRATFHELWQQRFNSDYVFDSIRRSNDYNKVFGIFRSNLFQTNEELKQSLNSAISPYQFSILETNDRIPAAKYTKDGKFDTGALRKYVREKLEKELKSLPGKSLLDVKYKEIFAKALEKDKSCKATVYNYTFKVQQLKNIYLKRILEEFFRRKNMEKPKIQIPINNNKINTIVGNIVVSELINQIQKNAKEEILSDDTLNDEVEENSNVEIDKDVNPSISCILFGNEICNSVCVLYANMMNFQSRGMCDSNNLCICYNHRDRKISDSQLPNVKRTADGKFDETALVKYVTESVDKNLKSESGKFLLDVNYEEKFKEALENAKDEKNFVPEYNFKITQLKNKTLENMFEKFLKENKMTKTDAANPELPEEAITLLLVDNTIVNTVIDRIEAKRKTEIDKDGNPSMSCILFGKEVCNGICVMHGRLLNFQSSGDCDSNNICTCYNRKDIQVSDSQRPSIKPNEKGRYDEKDLVKYLTENADRKLKSELGRSLLNIKYKDRFRKALENSKNEDTFVFDYTFKITQLKNTILENIFNEFLKENKMENQKPDFGTIISGEDDWLMDLVDNTIINTMIDRIEENSGVEIDEDVNPSISCLLFGNEICNSVCVLYANMMNFQSRGMCDPNNLCICYNHRDKKISDSQVPVVKRTADGKFDETALVKYVTESVDKNLKSESGKFLLDVNYEEKFKEALENAKDEKNFVPEYNFKITQLKNKTLENMFDKFLKENKMKKTDAANPELPEEAITLLLVDNTIVNTVIDRIEANRKVEIDKDEDPSMSCILFGKEVCNGICVMHGRLSNFQSSGDCDSNNICTCYNQKDTPVSDSQRPSIKPNKKGKYNEKALVKYLTENVDRKLKSELGQSLLNIKYKDRFKKALENSKDEENFVDNYTFRVTQLKNTILENIFNRFLKENKMKKSALGTIVSDENYWLMDRVDNTIINTLIDRIEKQNQTSQKSSMTKGKNTRVARAASAGTRKAAKKP